MPIFCDLPTCQGLKKFNEIPASKGKKLLKIQKIIFIFDIKSPFTILLCQCNKKHPFVRMQTVPGLLARELWHHHFHEFVFIETYKKFTMKKSIIWVIA